MMAHIQAKYTDVTEATETDGLTAVPGKCEYFGKF